MRCLIALGGLPVRLRPSQRRDELFLQVVLPASSPLVSTRSFNPHLGRQQGCCSPPGLGLPQSDYSNKEGLRGNGRARTDVHELGHVDHLGRRRSTTVPSKSPTS